MCTRIGDCCERIWFWEVTGAPDALDERVLSSSASSFYMSTEAHDIITPILSEVSAPPQRHSMS